MGGRACFSLLFIVKCEREEISGGRSYLAKMNQNLMILKILSLQIAKEHQGYSWTTFCYQGL